MATEAEKKSKAKYRREKVKRFTVDFYPSEVALWGHLQAQDNKQAYIKDLIRREIEGK